MIRRTLTPVLERVARQFPVVSLFGPRQSGKTTLVKAMFPEYRYLNLENPETRALLREDPKSLLGNGRERVIIDEAQRQPDVLSWVQVFVDRENEPGQFVITGSNQPALGEAVSQSLAGRASIHHLLPLSVEELEQSGISGTRDERLLNGFLPRLYDVGLQAPDLYSGYFATYVERDVRRLINVKDISRFETFVRLLAGRVGQLVNLSSLAGAVGVSSPTLSGWLSALEASYVVVRLQPFASNRGKRLVKTPKVYFTEPGLLAWLLQIETVDQMSRDPLLGNLFENMVVMESLKASYHRGLSANLSFYRDQSGLEVDLIREYQRRPFAIEIKAGRTYIDEMSASLRRFRALEPDLHSAAVVYAGDERAQVRGIHLVPYPQIASMLFEDAPE